MQITLLTTTPANTSNLNTRLNLTSASSIPRTEGRTRVYSRLPHSFIRRSFPFLFASQSALFLSLPTYPSNRFRFCLDTLSLFPSQIYAFFLDRIRSLLPTQYATFLPPTPYVAARVDFDLPRVRFRFPFRFPFLSPSSLPLYALCLNNRRLHRKSTVSLHESTTACSPCALPLHLRTISPPAFEEASCSYLLGHAPPCILIIICYGRKRFPPCSFPFPQTSGAPRRFVENQG
jgi:hypothetical protein